VCITLLIAFVCFVVNLYLQYVWFITCMSLYAFLISYTHTHIHTHIHTHTYIHTHIHTYTSHTHTYKSDSHSASRRLQRHSTGIGSAISDEITGQEQRWQSVVRRICGWRQEMQRFKRRVYLLISHMCYNNYYCVCVSVLLVLA